MRVTCTSRGGEHGRYVPPAWADRYPDAQRLAEAVVAADPLREAMWRTLMRVRSAVGDYDGVVSTFAQSQRALRAAEIAPAAATRALLDQLRR